MLSSWFYLSLALSIATVLVVAVKGFNELMAPVKAAKAAAAADAAKKQAE